MLQRRAAGTTMVIVPFLMSLNIFACRPTPEPLPVIAVSDTLSAQDSVRIATQLTRARGGWHDAPCVGCQQPGEVQIHVVGKTTDIKAKDGPMTPRAVAVIRNRSDEDVVLGPTNFRFQAKHWYLMIVSRGSGADTNAKWSLIPFKIGADFRPVIGDLVDCGDPPTNPKIDDAGFYNCGDRHYGSASIHLIKTAYAARRALLATITKTGWISCDPDCCTGSSTYAAVQ
jgi:hypothetical protein